MGLLFVCPKSGCLYWSLILGWVLELLLWVILCCLHRLYRFCTFCLVLSLVDLLTLWLCVLYLIIVLEIAFVIGLFYSVVFFVDFYDMI